MLGPGIADRDVESLEQCLLCERESAIFDEEKCEMVCSECGAVISEGRDLSQSAEAQLLSARLRDKGGDANMSLALHDLGLSTSISNSYKDAHGVAMEPKHRQHMFRLKRLDKFATADRSRRRSVLAASFLLNTIKHKLGLSEVIAQKAGYNYGKAVSMQLVKGRSIKGMAVASMYLACREFNAPKSIGELSMVIDADPRFSRRCFNILLRTFKVSPSKVNSDAYLNRAANILGIRGKSYRRALDILNVVKGHHSSQGKNPRAIAAASIYLATSEFKDHSITMAKLAITLDVSVVALRKRIADILEHRLVQFSEV